MSWHKEFVEQESIKIKEKLSKAVLMGEPIDMSNEDELILCAYMMGKQEADNQAYKDMQFQRELFTKALGQR